MLAVYNTQGQRKSVTKFDLNEGSQKPASFSLDGWKQILHHVVEWPADRPFFCTHVDLKNALWSVALLRPHARAFGFGLRWEVEDGNFCMSWVPFRWKHPPLFCQTAVGRIVCPFIPDGYLLFQDLDDFMIQGPDPVRLRAITARVVRALEEAGFLVSSKETLDPTTRFFFANNLIWVCTRSRPTPMLSYDCLTCGCV